jgi:hypothetical protein
VKAANLVHLLIFQMAYRAGSEMVLKPDIARFQRQEGHSAGYLRLL